MPEYALCATTLPLLILQGEDDEGEEDEDEEPTAIEIWQDQLKERADAMDKFVVLYKTEESENEGDEDEEDDEEDKEVTVERLEKMTRMFLPKQAEPFLIQASVMVGFERHPYMSSSSATTTGGSSCPVAPTAGVSCGRPLPAAVCTAVHRCCRGLRPATKAQANAAVMPRPTAPHWVHVPAALCFVSSSSQSTGHSNSNCPSSIECISQARIPSALLAGV